MLKVGDRVAVVLHRGYAIKHRNFGKGRLGIIENYVTRIDPKTGKELGKEYDIKFSTYKIFRFPEENVLKLGLLEYFKIKILG